MDRSNITLKDRESAMRFRSLVHYIHHKLNWPENYIMSSYEKLNGTTSQDREKLKKIL